ncbi:toxin ParE1/3/4 [Rhizobium sp. SG_E_25_P2]|uniref:type II toxin-antitoxin system RelE/ParE family toxin n=1 Tax=Rhizobium sp. SG_E_25_P2 TaxID=2879942 RepID=UPI002473AA31|nr:type II toxin-antitoxin system RelE/ParE family toxin [Rhizobium sp. SG_E_25_P2]MDH6268431.1 toxin ParE1/3/4 [Rhizobium sp. SG_E_25_P2]
MRRLVYLPSAAADLVALFDFRAPRSGSVNVSRDFIEQLRRKSRHAASQPGMIGRARPELHPDVRCMAFKGYVILFRYRDALLEVVAVVEGHRDIEVVWETMFPD